MSPAHEIADRRAVERRDFDLLGERLARAAEKFLQFSAPGTRNPVCFFRRVGKFASQPITGASGDGAYLGPGRHRTVGWRAYGGILAGAIRMACGSLSRPWKPPSLPRAILRQLIYCHKQRLHCRKTLARQPVNQPLLCAKGVVFRRLGPFEADGGRFDNPGAS